MTGAPHFSPCVTTDALCFLSGQLAFDAQGRIEGDIASQTRQCLDNAEAILAGQGLSRTDIVKVTVFLTDKANAAGFNIAYADFFGADRPARSTVVCDLLLPGALIEIEMIAALRPA